MLSKVLSSITADLESLVRECIGCCLVVHRELGPGLNESAYAGACHIELRSRGLSFEKEKAVCIRYRGEIVCHQRIDLVVERRVIVELKSVEKIHSVHVAQTVSYLRATGLRVALVVNFNVPLLKQGIRRVVQ
jgi:GxxExxY protein